MENYIKILNEVRQRYLVLIGKKSLEKLMTFMSGCIRGIYEVTGNIEEFLGIGFQKFIEKQFEVHNNIFILRHWSNIIKFLQKTMKVLLMHFIFFMTYI